MDDLLKSVANEDMAVQLIKKVTGIWHEGGLFYIFILYFNSVENHKKRGTVKNVLVYIYQINTN